MPASVVVHDLDFKGIGIGPLETDAPLIFDPDTVLSLAIA
jgi:hypothetical protein